MASPHLSEIVTTTLRHRNRKLADNMTNNNVLLARLKARGKRKPAAGGESILEELEYDENQTFLWFSGYDPLDVRPSDVMTAAEFDWKEAAVAVTISEREQRMNMGRERMIPLLERRISNAEKTFMNEMSKAIHSDGTGSGGKQLTGLMAAVPANTTVGDSRIETATYGRINRANWTFWRPQHHYVATLDISEETIKSLMIQLWLRLCRNQDKTDLIVSNDNMYRAYWEALQTQQRFTNPNLGKMGFMSLKFDMADVVSDQGVGGPLTANTMYFLNTDYIYFRPHSSSDVVTLDDRMSVNQAALVKLTYFMGNMTCSNQMLQGRLSAGAVQA